MLNGIRDLSGLDPQHNSLHKNLGQFSWGLLPEVATDSSVITRNTLPPNYGQFYQGADGVSRLYFNINNSIVSTPISDPSGTATGLNLSGKNKGDVVYYDGSVYRGLPSGTSSQYLASGATPSWTSVAVLSNVVFSFSGGETDGSSYGMEIVAGQNYKSLRWMVVNTTYLTVIRTKFIKISGISTVAFYAYVLSNNVAGAAYCQVDIGGQTGAVSTPANHDTIQWVTANVDVSGLTNGTVYDVAIQLKASNATDLVYLSSIIGIAS